MRNRTIRPWRAVLALAALVALPIPLAAAAQTALGVQDAAMFETRETAEHRGHVVALDRRDRGLVLRGPNGDDQRFVLTEQAQIVHRDQRLDFDALRLGQELKLRAELHQGERRPVDLVTVLDARSVAANVSAAPPLRVADTVTVTAVDPKASRFTVKTASGSETYQVGDGTRILAGTTSLTLSDLDAGDRVVVNVREGDGEGDGDRKADLVQVVVDPSES